MLAWLPPKPVPQYPVKSAGEGGLFLKEAVLAIERDAGDRGRRGYGIFCDCGPRSVLEEAASEDLESAVTVTVLVLMFEAKPELADKWLGWSSISKDVALQ